METTIIAIPSATFAINGTTGYIIGAVIALIILGYLVFSLVKPEKF